MLCHQIFMDMGNITSIKSSISTKKLHTHPFNPVSFMLLGGKPLNWLWIDIFW